MNMLGGISSSKGLHKIVRDAALYVSLFLSLYTLGFALNIFDTPTEYAGTTLGLLYSALWAISGVVQYFIYSDKPLNMLIRMVWFTLLASTYLGLVAGISTSPFVACWMIISAVAYAYFMMPGFILSLVAFWFAVILNSIAYVTDVSALIYNISVGLAITVTITVILLFFRLQERDDAAYLESKKEEERQRLSLLTLVNNLTDAVISTDKNGNIKLYNAAAVNLLDTNVSLDNTKIDTVLKLTSGSDEPISAHTLLKNAERLVVSDEYFAMIGAERIRLEIAYSPIRDDDTSEEPRSFIIIMRDITKAKSLEEERDEFISVVSHELRTPIAITEGAIDNAQIIFDRASSKKEDIKKTLHLAHEQVIFLSRMVNDLSTLSRAERGVADETETIDVKELAHSLHDEYLPQATAKGLTLNLHAPGSPGSVNASRLYLQELLQNFITNSIKYTKEGSVDLTIKKQGDDVLFSVKDSGIGISKSDQKKIFEKFYRSEDYRTRETGGTGLGLYVAQKLAHKLGCRIDVTSRLNHGSTFSFTLPQHHEAKK